jgi:hypothetical protein
MLLEQILAQWQRPAASRKAMNLLHQAMHMVLYQHTTMVIKMSRKIGAFFHHCFVCCCPGSHWGNMEGVVAQWQHPVASGVALDMLHWAMQAALHPRIRMAIKMVYNGGVFVCQRQFFA